MLRAVQRLVLRILKFCTIVRSADMAFVTKNLQGFRSQRCLLQSYCVNLNRFKFISSNVTSDLPWTQSFKDVFYKDPLHHRLVGIFLFRRVLKQAKVSFSFNEFSEGVKNAVKVISESIKSQDLEKLKGLLGMSLHRQYKVTFDRLRLEKRNIHLNIEAFKGVQIAAAKSNQTFTTYSKNNKNASSYLKKARCGARFIFGDAEPGDEYILTAFGQKIILSKNEMDEFEEEKSGNTTMLDGLKYGKKFGEAAFQKRIRFQFDVKFQTKESYKLLQNDESLEKEEKVSVIYHKWRFETPIFYNETQVLDWSVTDVDSYLKNKYQTEIIEDE